MRSEGRNQAFQNKSIEPVALHNSSLFRSAGNTYRLMETAGQGAVNATRACVMLS